MKREGRPSPDAEAAKEAVVCKTEGMEVPDLLGTEGRLGGDRPMQWLGGEGRWQSQVPWAGSRGGINRCLVRISDYVWANRLSGERR